jgi:methyl-accepting chemotaxis protein
MFKVVAKDEFEKLVGIRAAIEKSLAVIEFKMDGTVVAANQNFLNIFGYTLSEVVGRHHRMFMAPEEHGRDDYRSFWHRLNKGEYQSALYKRLGKSGREVWIQATYTPVLNDAGVPVKVVKLASDVTDQEMKNADLLGQAQAIDKSQAMIEFRPDGSILNANQNFLDALGYSLSEIQGRHHSLFVEEAERASEQYRAFWSRLRAGEYQAAEYKRIGKGGREVWIQATYNPILDRTGKVIKVVKFATDITGNKQRDLDLAGQVTAIGKSQAVIEFKMDGTILDANDNFLSALGYRLGEIRGQHHRMFVSSQERESPAYREFWAALNRGEYQAAEFRRIGKNGREIWIQAAYSPIFDLNGRPYKVVKYATDITEQVVARQRSEHVCNMIESVAAGAEEMNVSVQEIASSMQKSKATAEMATDRVVSADHATGRLTQTAEAMVGIVNLISGITNQINLLALNATIESARAGEAGRGFAVVANEVKMLAAQAKSATEKIGDEINGLHAVSSDVVSALNGIRSAIHNVGEYVSSTAAAIEEQSAIAAEMSSSMQRAAQEAAQVGR